MERSRLINKWMGVAKMSFATDAERQLFTQLLSCLSDIELARPFIAKESEDGKSLDLLCSKYELTIMKVRHSIKRAKQCREMGLKKV